METPDCATFNKMIVDNPNSPDLFSEHYHFSYHFGKLFMYCFKSLFSVYEVVLEYGIDNTKFIEKMKQEYLIPEHQIIKTDVVYNNSKKQKVTEATPQRYFIILRHGLAVCVDTERLLVMYNNPVFRNEALHIAEISEEFKNAVRDKKEFYMVTRTDFGNNFELKSFAIKDHEVDIENNYNEDFPSINNLITESLSSRQRNGIILLHGHYGTGKTYYIRHLINSIAKKFIYMPMHMVEWISDPEFMPYMSKFENSVLILEDCEDMLIDRSESIKRSSALSNLLNLGDGLLSDALSFNVICTFNANMRKIDEALLRKGRLIARYEFRELEIKKAQTLADKLGKNIAVEKPMTLTDIFNCESMKFENKEVKKMGFEYA
jgi:hypothetical protein